jgi:hypothetical protein
MILLGINKSWKSKGALDSNQDGMILVIRRRSFNSTRDYFHSAGRRLVVFLRSFMNTRDPQALQLIPLRSL